MLTGRPSPSRKELADESGWTIVELLLVLGIGIVIATALFTILGRLDESSDANLHQG